MSTDNQENVESVKKGPPPTKGAPPNFTVAYLVPLFLYFFASFKLYMSAIDDKGVPTNSNPQSKIALLQLAFMVGLFLMMYSFNIKTYALNCPVDSKNFALNAFLYTFLPFIFIMGTLITILVMMPGWKAPFSNTIGYFIVKNVWARKLFNLQEWIKVDGDNDAITGPLKRFNNKTNRTFFVNELTPDNFFEGIKSLNIGPGLQFDFHPKNDEEDGKLSPGKMSGGVNIMKQLYSAVILKDMISEFIWYFLGGLLAYSVSQINIIDGACDKGVQKDKEFDSGEEKEEEVID
jgi:hypothetical protein